MRFVEESDGTFSAAQLAAAERELEEQKKEWELDRLRAMKEEEERQKRMSDDDENLLTFSSEDAKNQVNNSNSSRRASNKLGLQKINNRGRRGNRGRRVNRGRRPSVRNHTPQQERSSRRSSRFKTDEDVEHITSSDSEVDTTSMTDLDSNDDDNAHNSSDGHRGSRLSSSDGNNSDEHENGDDEKENNEGKEDCDFSNQTPIKNKFISNFTKNRLDMNSPRTRSSGEVKINLWALDCSPILPESKTKNRGPKPKKCS